MEKPMKTLARIALFIFSVALVPAVLGQDLPPGEGRETLMRVCTACHDIEAVPRLRYSREGWASLVSSMKDMGADATDAELAQIVNYLAKNFGKVQEAAKKTNINYATTKEIEAGLGLTAKESELIVGYRTKNGNFKDVDSVLKVEGVDAAKIQSAKDKIEF
jgi:competence ComEA-like helix-hairpin-helix protein